MSSSSEHRHEIIRQLDSGLPAEKVAKTHSWNALSQEDREWLLEEAERRIGMTDPQKRRELVLAAYHMTREYPWDRVRALALIVQFPDDDLTSSKRKGALQFMSTVLEKIRDTLSDRNAADIQRYERYKADYHALEAKFCLGQSDIAGAIHSYQEALALYQRCDLQKGSCVKEEIDRLEALSARGEQLLPLDCLKSEQLRVQEELLRCKEKATTAQKKLSEVQAECKQRNDQLRGLEQKVDTRNKQLQDLEEKHNKQQEDIRRQQSTLWFLEALPRAAMAPLWVEVVRLALRQGEIDELTRQALERLSLDFPQDAPPLLAEIAARSPEPFAIDTREFGSKTARGFRLMAEARKMKEEHDLTAAAEALVEAWDMLLACPEEEE